VKSVVNFFFILSATAFRSGLSERSIKVHTTARVPCRERNGMKPSFRFSPVVMAVVAAMATAAIAQPPPPGGPDSPPPGPGKPGSGYPKPLGRIELPAPEPPPHGRHYRSPGYAGDSTVAQVQRALKARGFYAGPVDGDAGAGTRAAIRSFRREHGLGYSTRIDGALLHALRI
jgi:hypothetical protein